MCYVEISWMMRPGINFRFSGLIFPHFGKTATAAILETKWRMLWPRKFKAHVLSWNQLNEATRYQLPVFWLDFSEFRKKTAMAAILDSKWRILRLRKFKDHVLRRSQLSDATRNQRPVLGLILPIFGKNRHGRHSGFKMADVMILKFQGPCATSKSIESVDKVSTCGFLARFFRLSEKRPWPPSWIQNGPYYNSENSTRMC